MEIQINGESTEVPDGCRVDQLLTRLELSGRRLAIELNGEIVPRAEHDKRELSPGDRLEIVHAIGGGSPAGHAGKNPTIVHDPDDQLASNETTCSQAGQPKRRGP